MKSKPSNQKSYLWNTISGIVAGLSWMLAVKNYISEGYTIELVAYLTLTIIGIIGMACTLPSFPEEWVIPLSSLAGGFTVGVGTLISINLSRDIWPSALLPFLGIIVGLLGYQYLIYLEKAKNRLQQLELKGK